MSQKRNEEFQNFDATMRELMKVPHSEIKAKLDAEKSAKAAAKKNTAKRSGKKRTAQ